MAITENRVRPLTSLQVFLPGQGQPIVTRRAFRWYDVLSESAKWGTSSRDSVGMPHLEYLESVGLVCRANWTFQDTRLTQWTTSGGSWEEERPAAGAARKYRLVQYSEAANVAYSVTTNGWQAPADPAFAFTLAVPDTPGDANITTTPPYNRVEFGATTGQNGWAVQFSKVNGNHLLLRVAGVWGAVAELPEPLYLKDIDEALVIVRCHRGAIHVSTDFGQSYTSFGIPGTAIAVPGAPLTLRGQGGVVVFGLHQITYAEGTLTSVAKNMLPPVSGYYSGASVSITGRSSAPTGTSLGYANAGSLAAGTARYTTTLTPASSTPAGAPWAFYRTPELYSVTYKTSIAQTTPLGQFITPFDSGIRSIRIDKPRDIDTATASLTIRKDPDSAFVWNLGRYPRVALYLGWMLADGSESWNLLPSFVGYIGPLAAGIEQYRAPEITLGLVNLTHHLKRARWKPTDRIPYGGYTVNEALDDILATEGFGPGDRSWHARGDSVTLPEGKAEDPFEWPRDGESKWESMRRLAGHAGLEIGCSDDGLFYTQRRNYITPFITQTLQAVPPSTLTSLVQKVGLTFDPIENVTHIICRGEGIYGEELLAAATDYGAETFPLNPRFVPWQDSLVDEVSGTTSSGLLGLRAVSMTEEYFPPRFEGQTMQPVNLDSSRRDRVTITRGDALDAFEELGISELDQFYISSLTHLIEPFLGECNTVAVLQRIEP